MKKSNKNDEINKIVGSRIRWARNANNMTLEQLAKKMGYTSRTTISHIELGERNLTMDRAQQFAKALNVDPMWLIGLSDEPSFILVEEDPLNDVLKQLNRESKEFLLEYAKVLLKQQERFYGDK